MKGSAMMSLTEQRKESMYKYAKEKLKRIPLDVQKEKYEEIKAAADAAGESVNGYIKKVIDEKITKVEIPLTGCVNWNEELQQKLQDSLLSHKDALRDVGTNYCSNGDSSLILNFKSPDLIASSIVQNFVDILESFNIFTK